MFWLYLKYIYTLYTLCVYIIYAYNGNVIIWYWWPTNSVVTDVLSLYLLNIPLNHLSFYICLFVKVGKIRYYCIICVVVGFFIQSTGY